MALENPYLLVNYLLKFRIKVCEILIRTYAYM